MKVCTKCKQALPVAAFRTRKRADGTKAPRSICRSCDNARKRPDVAGASMGGYLPVGPFRDWIDKKIAEIGSADEVAHLLNMHPRTIYRIRKDSKRVSLYLVDDALTSDGTIMLWELYPEA